MAKHERACTVPRHDREIRMAEVLQAFRGNSPAGIVYFKQSHGQFVRYTDDENGANLTLL